MGWRGRSDGVRRRRNPRRWGVVVRHGGRRPLVACGRGCAMGAARIKNRLRQYLPRGGMKVLTQPIRLQWATRGGVVTARVPSTRLCFTFTLRVITGFRVTLRQKKRNSFTPRSILRSKVKAGLRRKIRTTHRSTYRTRWYCLVCTILAHSSQRYHHRPPACLPIHVVEE